MDYNFAEVPKKNQLTDASRGGMDKPFWTLLKTVEVCPA